CDRPDWLWIESLYSQTEYSCASAANCLEFFPYQLANIKICSVFGISLYHFIGQLMVLVLRRNLSDSNPSTDLAKSACLGKCCQPALNFLFCRNRARFIFMPQNRWQPGQYQDGAIWCDWSGGLCPVSGRKSGLCSSTYR